MDCEHIKRCNAVDCSVVTMESFDSNLLLQVSSASTFDFTVDNTKRQSDILTSLKVLSTYFTDAVMHKAITLTSSGSLTLAIAVTLLLQGILVHAYTFDHTISFVEASREGYWSGQDIDSRNYCLQNYQILLNVGTSSTCGFRDYH